MSSAGSLSPLAEFHPPHLNSTPGARVLHLLDAAGGSEHLWGKERVVLALALAQQQQGILEPLVWTLAPSFMATEAAGLGLTAGFLRQQHSRWPLATTRGLRELLHSRQITILHTHGYKANLVGRLLRLLPGWRKPALRLIATCHGWVDLTWKLRLYNQLDRVTSPLSDVVTVPNPGMLPRFPHRACVQTVFNGIADAPLPDAAARQAARARFGWSDDLFVVGTLGRLSLEKGCQEFRAAAALASEQPALKNIRWAFAGEGPLKPSLEQGQPSTLQLPGFVRESTAFLAGLDLFVQPSRSEGLSLALLEAARAALPIVATRVGATALALRDGVEADLIDPYQPEALVEAVARLHADTAHATALGQAARRRFVESFRIEAMERAYREIYQLPIP